MPIRTLPADVVDQIAAGEVVERPAHMVKELVENSLDAGATDIEIDFDQGGRYVRVKDNGSGITFDELPLAVARHATSKITLSSDIWRIHSYGFRGEALATIGAVSRLQLVSRSAEQKLAGAISLQFGEQSEALEQGGEFGTVITVSDLFSNVPARLKFLKSEAAETSQIKHVAKGLALANPKVGFRLKQKGKLIYHWPAQNDFQSRVEQVLGLSPMFTGFGEDGAVKAEVVIAPPQVRERNSRQIWTLVQNRLVQDRSLQAAVTEAYRHLLMHGDFPVAVLNVTCLPEVVDINIHPTKSAVKFQQPSQAFRAVHRAVRQILEKAPWLADSVEAISQPMSQGNLEAQEVPIFSSTVSTPIEPTTNLRLHDAQMDRTQFAQLRQYAQTLTPVKEVRESNEPKFEASHELDQALARPVSDCKNVGRWGRLQVLGQANLTYIIAQDQQGLVLIDQHAAHERVAFERLMRSWQGGWIDIQQYLLPLTLNMEAEQVEALQTAVSDLEKLGIQIETSGPTTVSVRSAPTLLKESAMQAALLKLAQEISQQGGSFAAEKAIGDLCATLACHSVVRAGQALSEEQMTSLLQQMDEFPLSSFCPHGRPVSVEYNWPKLEREFGRLV
ncbi:MAG: DNA mismatch repair endonuclease MutL [Bdellovibrionales bacterium]